MFRRILMANRGEVAARVARTCKRLEVEMIAVASEADRGSAWLSGVERAVQIGPAHPSASYLNQDALIEVALQHRCAALHPGWGFLAENALFASRCADAGLVFIGPSPRHIRLMGDKAAARATMGALGLPLIPGTPPLENVAAALTAAEQIGYPVLLKAVAGGGGRGMRRVDHPSELPDAFAAASAEAQAAFGDGRMYLERRIVGGRHVEVQVIADRFGSALHLFERECSIQRRHQKVIEEAPSPGLSASERDRILPLVADVVARSGYRNAGTIEMLLDERGELYFMEMNTRLQVEHPITEAITGIDLVEWQLRVAAGERLPADQASIQTDGHAIECRINAEDPDDNFRPSPGQITSLSWPQAQGIRVDTHLEAGDSIPPFYDSMVAKLICHAPTRHQAIDKMLHALSAVRIEGVKTNIALHQRILQWSAFVSGRYDTTSLESFMAAGGR